MSNTAHIFEDIYKGVNELGENPILIQSFVLNNNADIIKAIEYWESKRQGAPEARQATIQNHITDLELIMLQRTKITKDIFSTTIEVGASSPIEDAEIIKDEKKVKTIKHPASEGKEETKSEDKSKKKGKKKELSKTEYDEKYKTDEEKIEAIGPLIENIQNEFQKALGLVREKGETDKEFEEKKERLLARKVGETEEEFKARKDLLKQEEGESDEAFKKRQDSLIKEVGESDEEYEKRKDFIENGESDENFEKRKESLKKKENEIDEDFLKRKNSLVKHTAILKRKKAETQEEFDKKKKDLLKEVRKGALRKLKYHFKAYGEGKHFCTEKEMNRIVDWLEEDSFRIRSPLAVLRGEPLSYKDIIDEARRLVFEFGLGEQELKDAIKPYVLNQTLKEHKGSEDTIRTEEAYDNFFRSSLLFLLSEDQQRRDAEALKGEPKNKAKKPKTKEEHLQLFYAKYKELGGKAVPKIATALRQEVGKKDNEYTINGSFEDTVKFIKEIDGELYKQWLAPREQNKNDAGGEKVETKESKEEDKPKEVSPEVDSKEKTVSKGLGKFPQLEKWLKDKPTRSSLTDYLIAIINHKVDPIGNRNDGIDKKIEDLMYLARKRILEMGMAEEEMDQWTETDVSKYMAEEVVPYITDYYGILSAENDEEVKEHLKFYLQNYGPGEEKERAAKLNTVLTSEIPRTNFVKKGIARQVRKGNMSKLNDLIKEINVEEAKKVKTENKE